MEFSRNEQKILKQWEKEGAFQASLKARSKAPRFVFYEGPPTANGRPGIHHVLARAFKDAVCRYKTMRGFLVERRAGWDTHGLPVELEVEKELGLKSKQDIERYGIARFNARSKKSVWRYKNEWEKLTQRIGFWIDLEHPYITYQNEYIETLWGIIKHVHGRKLLYEDFKVVPWCSRCGSTLSSHEVALGYESVTENSVFVKFKAKGRDNTFILAWTTTPWTLPGNVALAVGEDIEYAEAHEGRETYILATATLARIFPEGVKISKKMKGKELVGLSYEPLFAIPETKNDKSHKVYAADFVNTEEGTGVVHTAAMYGEDDYQLALKVGLPKVHTVDEQGKFLPFVPEGLAGKYVKAKDTEADIIAYVQKRGFLFREESYTHDYPFCWRCKSPLLYYAKKSWFIKMSALRAKLISENKKIQWIPEHLKEGRFGEWLREVKDWAFSRERFWGTPLPVWRCEKCDATEVIGSLQELGKRSVLKNRYLFVRHGRAKSNVEGWASCMPEKKKNPLVKAGMAQARRAAAFLKKYEPDLIFSSPLERTRATAGIISKALGDLPVIIEEELQEFKLGTFNTRPVEEYHQFLGKNAEAHFTKKPLGGETWYDVRKRMWGVLRACERKYSDKTIVFVSHGDPLFVLLGAIRGATEGGYAVSYLKPYKNYQTRLKGKTFPYPKIGEAMVVPTAALPHDATGALDVHRPYADALTFSCKQCKGSMRRVPEVADVWFDSGAMPFASQFTRTHADFTRTDAENFLRKSALDQRKSAFLYPADFICEGIDQTRGWFYTLLAVATLLGSSRPYKNVISHGLVLDKHGKKMSKSLGNIVNPWDIVERYGADAVRWYFYTVNQPGDPKRFDEQDVKQAQQRFLGTLYNLLVFWQTYSGRGLTRTSRGQSRNVLRKSASSLRKSAPTALDRWILSRLATVVRQTTEMLDAYDLTGAARLLETFVVDDCSNWYVRRSRERFQRPQSKADVRYAAELLGFLLGETAKLAAPFTPFATEEIWRGLGYSKSVHLASYPEIPKTFRDLVLEADMTKIREAAALAHAERRRAGIRVRQPLASLSIAKDCAPQSSFYAELLEILMQEVNVKEIKIGERLPPSAVVLDTELTLALRLEGARRELVRMVQDMRKTIGLRPQQKIVVRVHFPGAFADILQRQQEDFAKAVGAREVFWGPKAEREKILIERTMRIEGAGEAWAAIVRA